MVSNPILSGTLCPSFAPSNPEGGWGREIYVYTTELKLNEVRIVSIRIHATTTVRTLECLRAFRLSDW